MVSNLGLLISCAIIIKQFYFYAGFAGDESFRRICDKLEKSGRFTDFKWAETVLFSEHFRKKGETYRTFEMKEGIKVLNLNLINTKLSGHLRILITICRAGFVIFSIVHSIVPERKTPKDRNVRVKNLTSTAPLTSSDVRCLLEEKKTPTHPYFWYELDLHKGRVLMKSTEILEYLLKNLGDYGLRIKIEPRKISKTIFCWDFNLSSKTFTALLEENYKDLFIMFFTPSDSSLSRTSEHFILKSLKSCLHPPFSEKRGFFFDSYRMLAMSPRKKKQRVVIHSQLIWLFQLVSLEDFLLNFYSTEVRRISSKLVSAHSDQYSALLENVVRLRESFSLALEDLYWVENDLFRRQSAKLVREYKQRFRLEERLNAIQKRFASIHDKCTEALTALEHKLLERREKSITNLTLIFASLGLGEILATFIVWYFGYILANKPAPTGYLVSGLVVTLLIVSTIFLIARWYVSKISER